MTLFIVENLRCHRTTNAPWKSCKKPPFCKMATTQSRCHGRTTHPALKILDALLNTGSDCCRNVCSRIQPSKPGKVRIEFDFSAKYRGSSLNDKLLQGPDLTNSLVGVLTRFRQEAVALMADVEAMFHQVKVVPEDCNALRFL